MKLKSSRKKLKQLLNGETFIGSKKSDCNIYPRCVTLPDLQAVACDGTYFAALHSDRVELCNCCDGNYIRMIDRRASSIQLSCGTVILQIGSKTEEYDVASGSLERIYG